MPRKGIGSYRRWAAPGSRPADTYRVRPSSVGGWLLQDVAKTDCANATDHSTWGAAQCDGIGRRAPLVAG